MSLKIDNAVYKSLKETGVAAQGDLLVYSFALYPVVREGMEVVHSSDGRHVVAHSETGHHHVLQAYTPPAGMLAKMADPVLFRNLKSQDPEMTSVVEIPEGSLAEIVHLRPNYTHETHVLPPGTWVLARQRRPTPQGWEKVSD